MDLSNIYTQGLYVHVYLRRRHIKQMYTSVK